MTIPSNAPASKALATDSFQESVAQATTPSLSIPPKTKLHGRAFYESIGSPKFILAPMVDQSEFVSISLHTI